MTLVSDDAVETIPSLKDERLKLLDKINELEMRYRVQASIIAKTQEKLHELELENMELHDVIVAARDLSNVAMMTWYGEATPDQLKAADHEFRAALAKLEQPNCEKCQKPMGSDDGVPVCSSCLEAGEGP